MFDVIIDCNKNNVIGKLPWYCSEPGIFNKTNYKFIIVDRKITHSLPQLKNTTIIVVNDKNLDSISDDLKLYGNNVGMILVTGDTQLYKYVFNNYKNSIRKVHLPIMKEDYKFDAFADFNNMNWTVDRVEKYKDFNLYVLSNSVPGEKEYLSLLGDVFHNGWVKNGRNGNTKSMFGKTISFDLTKGFPLLTTKKMFFRGVVEELLFFIRGDTNSKFLEDKKINIWKGNTDRKFLDSIGKQKRQEGIMGPMYGYQWRNFNAPYDEENASAFSNGFDQLQHVIYQIKNDPHSRRILLTDFNPLQANDGVLYPCHSIIIQFYVSDGFLDIFCFNRSSDLFHGLPFNIASTSLFQVLISKITGLTPRNLVLSLGDAHIYESHYDVVEKQLCRIPYKFPQLKIEKDIKTLSDIENMSFKDFSVIDYNCYDKLKADMVS
jgi:thymidylate synthase